MIARNEGSAGGAAGSSGLAAATEALSSLASGFPKQAPSTCGKAVGELGAITGERERFEDRLRCILVSQLGDLPRDFWDSSEEFESGERDS